MSTTIVAGLRTALGHLLAALLVPCLSVAQTLADPDAAPELSEYGVFYSRYEPTFYTGFAPRAEDPARLHLHVGRGNQLRITLVLSDRLLEGYARDLLARYRTYRRLIDSGRLILTQNSGFEAFAQTLDDIDLAAWVEAESALPAEAVRARNLELVTRLNPGRVFSIRIPVDALIGQWIAELRPEDRFGPSRERQLELLNQMLPTRLWVTELDPGVAEDLEALIAQVPEQGEASVGDLAAPYLALLDRISHGIYPRAGEELRFAELTAIHPVGTFNAYTSYRGRQIPQYPTPGRRALTYHQRTRTVDHIPDVVVYSYSPWIPYMHVGPRLHNAFHTLWWRMNPARTDFLPPALRGADRSTREGGRYERLWLLSRGPMSHGCTHVNTGHIAELRQILPAEPEQMGRVDTFINKSHLYDVFDIDGDLAPEVMGVRYFVAYSLRDKRPDRLRAPIERRAFYAWLYGGELAYEADGIFLMADSSQGGVPGVHAPFTAAQGAWECRAADDGALQAHALALNFVLPVDDHTVRFARVDYEARLDRQTGMLSGSATLGFDAEGDLEAADPLAAPGPVVEHFHVEGARIVPREHAIRSVRYACEDGHGLQVTFQDGNGGASAAIVQYHGGQLRLPHVPAASGTRYSDGGTELWTKGDEARFTLEGGAAQHCRPQN